MLLDKYAIHENSEAEVKKRENDGEKVEHKEREYREWASTHTNWLMTVWVGILFTRKSLCTRRRRRARDTLLLMHGNGNDGCARWHAATTKLIVCTLRFSSSRVWHVVQSTTKLRAVHIPCALHINVFILYLCIITCVCALVHSNRQPFIILCAVAVMMSTGIHIRWVFEQTKNEFLFTSIAVIGSRINAV